MVSTKALEFKYPDSDTFRFPDISVKAGEPLLVLGDSGCGKSTFLHLLAGLLKPTSGHIMIDGEDIAGMSASRLDAFRGKHVGLVYQRSYFIESLNILDNLVISPYVSDKSRAKEVAEELGIGHILNKLPSRVSVGEAQRATIARAVLHQPGVLLADEPTSALDNSNCESVIRLLKTQANKNEAALIIVTHDQRLKPHIPNVINLQSIMQKAQ